MVRTQIYLEESQKIKMEKLSANSGLSLGELIRQAIDELLGKKMPVDFKDAVDKTYGIWRNRDDLGRSDVYVRELRQGWHKRAKRLQHG